MNTATITATASTATVIEVARMAAKTDRVVRFELDSGFEAAIRPVWIVNGERIEGRTESGRTLTIVASDVVRFEL